MPEYPDSGALFPNTRKQGQQPDWEGTVDFSHDLISWLAGQARNNQPTTIRLAGWKKTSKKGAPYVSLKASAPRESQQQTQHRQRPRDDRPVMDAWGAVKDEELPF